MAEHRELNCHIAECFKEMGVWLDELNIPFKEGPKAYKTKLNEVVCLDYEAFSADT
jgi:hypothetical protein